MSWDEGVVRPVALDGVGAALSPLSAGRSAGGGGDGRLAAALGSVVAGGGVRARTSSLELLDGFKRLGGGAAGGRADDA